MQNVVFSFLAIVIALGGLWYHDVRHPPEEQAIERRKQAEMKDSIADQQIREPHIPLEEPPINPEMQPVASKGSI